MIGNLGGWHLVIILFLVLLLFGAPKLPALAKSVGQSMKILKKEVRDTDGDSVSAEPATSTHSTASANDKA